MTNAAIVNRIVCQRPKLSLFKIAQYFLIHQICAFLLHHRFDQKAWSYTKKCENTNEQNKAKHYGYSGDEEDICEVEDCPTFNAAFDCKLTFYEFPHCEPEVGTYYENPY